MEFIFSLGTRRQALHKGRKSEDDASFFAATGYHRLLMYVDAGSLKWNAHLTNRGIEGVRTPIPKFVQVETDRIM
jgi:hypothetical protein